MVKRKNIHPGDWFGVPLGSLGFAAGVVARGTEKTALFGYFFGSKHERLPTLRDVQQLKPDTAVLLARFSDLGLINGDWPLIGRSAIWDPSEWPMPPFVRRDIISGTLSLVTYDEENPSVEIALRASDFASCQGLPQD